VASEEGRQRVEPHADGDARFVDPRRGCYASSVSIGTDRRYAAIHQLGGKHMPARPFFPFTKEGKLVPCATVEVERIIEKALETEMKT
jgi:hypothetical protein